MFNKIKFPRDLITTFIVALVYAGTGFLGLYIISMPPGYATPIWIPSGFALGALMRWGRRVLPGIFLGSLTLNFLISVQDFSDTQNAMLLLIAFVIACGAVLQTLVGWWLIKKYVGINNRLNHPNAILSFAMLSGPVACVVNTTWSNTILLWLNVVTPDQYSYMWSIWWIGDSVGVLIFTPIFLILFARPRSVWRQRILPVLVPLCVSFAGVISLYITAVNTGVVTQIWPVLITGLLFCVLMNVILFIVNGQKNIAQIHMAAQRTALKLAEAKNLMILRSAGEGIFGVDVEGRMTFMNPAAAQMLGYEEQELLGKSVHDVVQHHYADGKPYPKDKSAIYTTMRDNKICYIHNEVFWRKDGEFFWVDYTCSPIIDNEKTTGAVIVFNDVTEQRQVEFTLEKMAHFDALTMLPNRYSFLEKLSSALQNAKQKNQLMAVCFIDLDNFKQINDNLGHTVGDETLKQIPKILHSELTRSDYLARLGGDELGVIIENIVSIDEVKLTLQRWLRALNNKPLHVIGHEIMTSFSIGVAIYPHGGLTADELIKNADIAMYKAKEIGNTYAFFDEAMSKKLQREHTLETFMHHALVKKELSLVYQPVFDVQTQELFGVEALLRWSHPKLGMIAPSEFIPIAEKNGLIHQFGEFVLEQAFQDYQQIASVANNKNILLAINISILQIEKDNFFVRMREFLKESQINSNILIFEITESGLMRHPEHAIKVMNDIKQLGVRFALDDFGVRYSSMQYLKAIPISLLKIDRNFVHDITTNASDAAIVKAIIQMSHGLGISTIVEGIESKEQFDFVKLLGTEYVQGFYFSKPLPLNELLTKMKDFLWLKKNN